MFAGRKIHFIPALPIDFLTKSGSLDHVFSETSCRSRAEMRRDFDGRPGALMPTGRKEGGKHQKADLNLVRAARLGLSAFSLACFTALVTSSSFSAGWSEQVE